MWVYSLPQFDCEAADDHRIHRSVYGDGRESVERFRCGDRAAARYPEWSRFIREAHATYRADVRDSHHALISFTDYAVAQADDPNR